MDPAIRKLVAQTKSATMTAQIPSMQGLQPMPADQPAMTPQPAAPAADQAAPALPIVPVVTPHEAK